MSYYLLKLSPWGRSLLRNIRFYILAFSVTLSFVYLVYTFSSFTGSTALIRLEQLFAFTATIFLYLALLAGPFCYTFRSFPYRAKYLKARRAIGVSAFYFAFLHFCITFFYQLGGVGGLSFLSGKYLFAISLSFTALLILASMAATSFDKIIEKMTFPKWKRLHRLVYLASFFILIHVLLLGTHFADLSGWIPQLYFYALLFLLILESQRIDAFFKKRFNFAPQIGIVTAILIGVFVVSVIYSFLPQGQIIPIGIHAQHIQLAKEAQQGAAQNATIPGMTGDRTKRFTVSFDHPDGIAPGTAVPLSFRVFDASTGFPVSLFQKVYDKTLHLIIVDSALQTFSHIHPDLSRNTFSISTSFPKDSTYHLYLDFQPFGAIEQQFAFTLPVGTASAVRPAFKPDTNLTKVFGKYEVTMNKPTILSAQEMAIGQQTLSFVIKDRDSHQPIRTLKPYLGAFGHLVMINQVTYDYLHVHPTNTVPPRPNQNGGPEVSFVPLGLYGPIKPGTYRVFAQLNPDNNLFTADFTVEVR